MSDPERDDASFEEKANRILSVHSKSTAER